MSTWDIGGPAAGGFDGAYRNSEHIPHHLLFGMPRAEERTGQNGKYSVAACDFVVCLTCKRGWSDTDVSGKVIAPAVLGTGKNLVTFRLGEGESKGEGFNAPILAYDPIPVEIEEVQALLTKYALQYPTGRVAFDVAQYNADHKPLT
jgi:hypothetical protein